MKKKRKNRGAVRFLKVTLITLVMVFAAVSGIYCAKLYTTPYTDMSEFFSSGVLQNVKISKEKCNILIMGTDKEGLRTDVMMIAQIDPKSTTATVMSIPRDTRVRYNGKICKINEVPVYARRKGDAQKIQASIGAVKELTGIPIHHFVKVNFDAFNDCIDELGGIEFNVPQRMYYKDPYQDLDIDLYPGVQILDGDKAEQLVRFRRYPRGDLDRVQVQQDFIHAVAEQKLHMKYIGKVDDIYQILSKNMETSMSPGDMLQCGTELLDIGTGNIATITMPGNAKDIGGGSYVIPDYNGILEVREASFGYDKDGNEIIR